MTPDTAAVKTLHAQHLAKSYKRRRVVKDINLEIAQGSVVGLLALTARARPPRST